MELEQPAMQLSDERLCAELKVHCIAIALSYCSAVVLHCGATTLQCNVVLLQSWLLSTVQLQSWQNGGRVVTEIPPLPVSPPMCPPFS